MTMWLPTIEGRRGPIYRRIADAIDQDVQVGMLRAGTKLPPHRDLADHLGVTVTTVTRAYTEAARRGLVNGHVGRGTFIRGQEPDDAPERGGVADLTVNFLMPDREVINLQARLFQRRALPWTQLLGYAPKVGHLRHRQAMAAWVEAGGLVADVDRIVLTAGAQHAIATTLPAVTPRGGTVLTEELTYSGMRVLAQQVGLKVRGVAMDAEGLRPDALDDACRATRAQVLYCMPRLQNPTSAVMSERRRRQVAAIAEKHRLLVVEDDTYGFLSPERTPLAALIPHRTAYITSLSKSLFAGMRLGCVVAPPAVRDTIARYVWATMIMTSPISADLLGGWIEDGPAARIANWKRHEFTARQQMVKRLLPGQRYQAHPSSPHLWLQLPLRWTSDAFVAEARARGVVVNASSEFAVDGEPPRSVRVCMGPPRTRAGLELALGRLAETLADRMPAARAAV